MLRFLAGLGLGLVVAGEDLGYFVLLFPVCWFLATATWAWDQSR